MVVRRVRLVNTRARRSLEVELGDGLNIVVGPNGAGKTTLLEALYLLVEGSPLRALAVKEMIRSDSDVLRIEADLYGPRGHTAAAAAYARDGTRRLTADGAPLEDSSRWRESLPVRTFLPDDLRVIKGSPRRRREYLDHLAAQLSPDYSTLRRRYEEALSQRNALLRTSRGLACEAEFVPWETVLAETGSAICRLRAEALRGFINAFQETYAGLTGEAGDSLHLVYRSNALGLAAEEYRARLAEMRPADCQRTFTHLGPHRDDLRLLRSGLDVRDYASQGEQRVVLLSLVLAEWGGLTRRGAEPLLLLDDVMSELDEERRRRLVSMLLRGGQVIVTATDLRYFSSSEIEQARVIVLDSPDMEAGGE
jgi:DNA replication and repair protein RecF